MNNIPKILISTFLTIFIFQMISLIFLLAAPSLTQAIDFTPQVGIPVDKDSGEEYDFKGGKITIDENSIGIYIKAIYKYAIGIVGIVAAVVLMMAGVIWLTAGGNQTRIGEAKSWIGAALTGLIIALTSYIILYIVNPDLVNFRPINVETVEKKEIDNKPQGATGTTCNANATPPALCPNLQYCGIDLNCYSGNVGSRCISISCQSGLTCIIGVGSTGEGICSSKTKGEPCCSDVDCLSNNCERKASDPQPCYESDVRDKKYVCL